MDSYRQTVAPTGAIVALHELRGHLRITHGDDDATIVAMETAAAALVEAKTGRSLLLQTWQASLDRFPAEIELLHGPVAAITSITYKDGTNTDAVLASYLFDNGPLRPWIRPAYGAEWPSVTVQPACVRVLYTTGAAVAGDVPALAKQAIKLLVGHWFENREAAGPAAMHEIPAGVEMLLAPLCIPGLF